MKIHQPYIKEIICLYSDLSLSSVIFLPLSLLCDLPPLVELALWLFSSIGLLPRCADTFCRPLRLLFRSWLRVLSLFDLPLGII